MPVVAMPDGTPVNFPDTMPAEQIKSLIAQKFPAEVSKVGTGEALARGAAQGVTANFYDELRGLMEAGGLNPRDPASLSSLLKGAYQYFTGDQGSVQRYDQATARERQTAQEAETAHPYASLAGNVAGALALPVGAIGAAATLPGRVAAGAATGAGYGALYGAGAGEGGIDRASRAITGAGLGAAVGAAAPAVVEGVSRGVTALREPIANTIRGIRAPGDEAARRVAVAIERDFQADPGALNRLTAQEFSASAQQGGPAAIMDIGGETTRALARSAANTSPEGRQTLNNAINNRFEGQSGRITGWLRNTFNFPDAAAQTDALKSVAKSVNDPAYRKAFAKGRVGVWDQDLQEISRAPVVQKAAKDATMQAQNRAVAGSLTDPASVFHRWASPDGKPTLEVWDLIKRQLDQDINVARKEGRNEDVMTLKQIKDKIVEKLDAAVPEYQTARAGAARFFDAQDSIEAGKNFVGKNMPASEAIKALAQMSPTERKLFQDGFVSKFMTTLEEIGDRRSVLNKIAESPAAREKLSVALGPQKAAELESGLRVEGIMDFARGAVQGNSTTARQLAELGLAGGTYGIGTGGNIFDPNPSALMNAALVYGALRGKGKINEAVSRKVAELLVSKDPKALIRGIKLVANNKQFLQSLRQFDQRVIRSGIAPAGSPGQMPVAVRADQEQQPVPGRPSQ